MWATELFEEAIAVDEEALGGQHPDVASRYKDLAEACQAQARARTRSGARSCPPCTWLSS